MSTETSRPRGLHKLLHTRISDDELRTLCIYVGVLYDDLAGSGLLGKTSDLILKLEQRGGLELLRHYLADMRPDLRTALLELGGVPNGVLTYVDLACKKLLPPPGAADVLRDPAKAYVPLRCRRSGAAGPDEDALTYLRNLFHTKPAVLVVGDYGTGKSFLSQRFFLEQAVAFRDRVAGAEANRPRLPILLPLRSVAGLGSGQLMTRIVEHLHMFGYFSGGLPPGDAELSAVASGLEQGQFLCILDGFDEIPLQAFSLDAVADLNRLVESLTVGRNRVLITTRPGVLPGVFAPSFAERVSSELGLGYLVAWDPEQQWHEYVAMCARNGIGFERGPSEFEQLVLSQPGLRQLTTTPLYCQMLVDSRAALSDKAAPSVVELYGMYIDQYFARVNERSLLSAQLKDRTVRVRYKHDCLAATAVGMLRKSRNRLSVADIEDSLQVIAGRYDSVVLKEFTKVDTLVYSLLVMDAGNTYSFSHKSFYEFYVARKLWQQLTSGGKPYALLERFLLTREIISFLADLLGNEGAFALKLARAFSSAQPHVALGIPKPQVILRRNLALLQLERSHRLAGVDLEGLDFSGYDFSVSVHPRELVNARLNSCQLEGATLTGVSLLGAQLRAAKLNRAVLDGADLRGADLTGAYLNDISCERTRFSGANLQDVRCHSPGAICAALRWEVEQAGPVDTEWLHRARESLKS